MTAPPLSGTELTSFWAGLTGFDWIIIVLLIWSTLLAFMRGFIRELASLAGLAAGLLLASWNYPFLASYLRRWVTSGALTDIIAFLLIVSAVTVIVSLLGRALRSGAHAVGLGLLDRLAGAAVGFARGVLAGVAIMMGLAAFLPPQPAVAKSRLAPYLLAAAHGVSFVVPQQLRHQVILGAAELAHARPQWIKPLP